LNFIAEIKVPIGPADAIANIFLSTLGQHCLVTTKQGDNYYVQVKSGTVYPLKKIKGVLSSVAWNPECIKEGETGHILLGTTQGAVIETTVSSTGVVSFAKEHSASFGSEKNLCISDLYLYMLNDDNPKAAKWLMLVCQPGRLHSVYASIDMSPAPKSNYIGAANLQAGWITMPETPPHIFHPFFSTKESQQICMSMQNAASSQTLPDLSALLVYPPHGEAQRFLWLGPGGITIGKINLFADKPRDIVEEEDHMEHRRYEGRLERPTGVSLTEYHMLLAYPNRLNALSIYTKTVVYEDVWPTEFGNSVGLVCDPTSGFQWLFTSHVTMKYKPVDENRYVWRVFLERGDYAKALTIARSRLEIDPEAHELVLKRQADKYIAEKNFTAAAEILAQSTEAFEAVVLKFMSADDPRHLGLKTLLEKKLDVMSRPEDRLRREMLVIWLLEIQLAELAEARREGRDEESSDLATHLQRFLMRKNVHDSVVVNKDAVYNLMASHADFDSQLFLAKQIGDFDRVIEIHLIREHYMEALEILKSQASNVPDLYYNYSPKLVKHISMELFASLIGNEQVRPQRMLPTLWLCQESVGMAAHALKYLEWAVETRETSGDVALHNLLLLLYARFRPKRLHEYLTKCGFDKTAVPYDLDFALRTCEQYKLEKSTVFLYCVSEMFSDAAFPDNGVTIAKECAHMMDPDEEDTIMGLEPKFSVEYRRRIWLKIASFVIGKTENAAESLALLKESGDVLSIQDILPFFPDFTEIKDFKEPLCECLKEHSVKIQELQQAMKDATVMAQEIREKTERLRDRVTVVKAGDVCAKCERSLIGRPFHAHHCRHFFHRECLEEEMMPFLSEELKARLTDLEATEKRLFAQLQAADRVPVNSDKFSDERKARFMKVTCEINEIIGTQCPLCGLTAIELIDKPFFTEEQFEADQESWEF
ncbi:Pep3/Vps18/deep orange family protein, partial [Cooperia oncophora]